MIQYKKILMTLALLLTAVSGAWAEDYTTVFELSGSTATTGTLTFGTSSVEAGTVNIHTNTDEIAGIKMSSSYNLADGKYFTIKPATGSFKAGDKLSIAVCFNNSDDTKNAKAAIYAADGATLLYTTANGINGRNSADDPAVEEYVLTQDADLLYIGRDGNTPTFVTTLKVERPASAEPTIDVKWDAATKTGTFEMPAFDVEIAPIYAPVAQWAKVENVDQIPTAIDGIIAGEAKAIVNEGTVAKAGSTENAQGTVMYLTTTDANMTAAQARDAATGWTSTVPTGTVLTGGFDKDQTVYVWYYIQGANTPDEQTATAENTFNDSEICNTPLTVTLKANQFNLTFSPAPVSNATVTVGGNAATAEQLNAGKIEKVGTGSEVKVKANTGYKFRKVEVKKKAEVLTITVAKGSTDLSGDKLLYYTPGETYRQAIANHPENKLDGGLGWNIWEGGNDATIFYKESADKSRDLSIDGDQHFRPTDSINLDTVIDPTLNFYFVAQF